MDSQSGPRHGLAKVGDAELYFERIGNGPPLLMIAGGGGDGGAYSVIGRILSRHYTLLTYDRRGNSRSRLLGAPRRIDIAEQADDAIAVLRANEFDSAIVFGSSGGATIALDIAARHPEAVEVVVAHEPPVPAILSDAKEILADYDKIERVLETRGWEEGFKLFLTVNRLTPSGEPVAMTALLTPEKILPPGSLLDLMKRQSGNWEYMMKYEVRPFIEYVPDVRRLSENGVRLALAAGEGTRGQYFHRTGEEMARRLGSECVEFPGGHSGAFEVPDRFAVRLRALLESTRPRKGSRRAGAPANG